MHITRITAAAVCCLAAACTLKVKNGDTDIQWGRIAYLEADDETDGESRGELVTDGFGPLSERPRPSEARVTWSDGGVERWASGKGLVVFADDDRSVKRMGDGAVLWIGETRGGVTREVYFMGSGYSQPRVIYDVDRVESEWDAAAREWSGDLLQDVVLHAELGARQRATRIHREGGADALLTSFEELRSPAPRAIYLEVLISADDADGDALAEALEACTGELARSGLQFSLYERLAERFPESSRLRYALIACGERAALSRDRFDIQRALLCVWSRNALADADLEARWIEACASTEPNWRADLSIELIARAPGGDRSRIAAMRAARGIPSSVLRAKVIERCSRVEPASEALLIAVVQEIDDLESASRREALLMELLEREALSAAVLDAIGDAAEGLGSPAAERRVLARLSVVRTES